MFVDLIQVYVDDQVMILLTRDGYVYFLFNHLGRWDTPDNVSDRYKLIASLGFVTYAPLVIGHETGKDFDLLISNLFVIYSSLGVKRFQWIRNDSKGK